MIHVRPDTLEFPDVSMASGDGLLAVGGDLSPERLKLAYSKGIFPWFNEGEMIQWWSPDPRFVLFPDRLKVSKSMRQLFNKNAFNVTINEDFEAVIRNCAATKRANQPGTWITNAMIDGYSKLHKMGFAKSIEVWQGDDLVGGLYGVDLGNQVFCGESMFTSVSNASKYGFIQFVQHSNYKLIDCQMHTDHLESLGAQDISRAAFLEYL